MSETTSTKDTSAKKSKKDKSKDGDELSLTKKKLKVLK